MGSKTGIYIMAIALALAGGLVWFVNRPKPVEGAAPLSADAKAYVRNLQLSDVTMKATESYVGQTVTEIEGKIGNSGGNIIEVSHQRLFAASSVQAAELEVMVEARDSAHADIIVAALEGSYVVRRI